MHKNQMSSHEWREHWQAQGQSWRTEPEIDEQQQEELRQRLVIVPDIAKNIYPFKGIRLSRADVEWLLATHENGRGPVDWSDQAQRARQGLDLRGADLRGVDLRNLPLARLIGGIPRYKVFVRIDQYKNSALHLDRAILLDVHLEGAFLRSAFLEDANFEGAHLDEAVLDHCHAERTNFYHACLERASLQCAHLQEADLVKSHLTGADLRSANLDGAVLNEAHVEGARFENALLDRATRLENLVLEDGTQGCISLADVKWGEANLSVVKWSQITMLGDEQRAQRTVVQNGEGTDFAVQLRQYEVATRANRQLALVLQAQGLNEDAARFAHHAQVLQRKVLWMQRNVWKWLGSAALALLAGYGYRMWRILVAYLIIVFVCAGGYFVLGLCYGPPMSVLDAILTSITAFHGRVFSEPFQHPGEPQLWVTAFEAIAGLIIEGVFIAMLTQKFFGK